MNHYLLMQRKRRGLDPKAEMWKMPASEVGAYAEEDAALTLELWHLFKKIIIEEDSTRIYLILRLIFFLV